MFQRKCVKYFAALAIAVIGPAALLVHADDSHPAAAQVAAPKPDADGFIEMFNGRDLTGWDGAEGYWSAKDGVISGHETKDHSRQTFLIYKAIPTTSNFEMHYKYKFVTKDGNSGVQFRSKVVNPSDPYRIGGYQADCDAQGGYDGGFYDEAGIAGNRGIMANRGQKTVWDASNNRHNENLPTGPDEVKKLIKVNDWNDVILVANGNHITYTVNGVLTSDLTDNSPKAVSEGLIGLQLHAGFTMEIQFKDLKIKLLENK